MLFLLFHLLHLHVLLIVLLIFISPLTKVLLKIKGRKTNRFIKRLNSNDIEILSLLTVSDNVVIIKVYYSDLDTIYKLNKCGCVCIDCFLDIDENDNSDSDSLFDKSTI